MTLSSGKHLNHEKLNAEIPMNIFKGSWDRQVC